MRNLLRRKPFHRLLLSTAIASLLCAPAAFAHTHHNAHASTHRAAHAGSRHHEIARTEHYGKRLDRHAKHDRSYAYASHDRKHVHVPDEEELAQPEL